MPSVVTARHLSRSWDDRAVESSVQLWRRARTRAGKATRGGPKASEAALVLYLYARGPTDRERLAWHLGVPKERMGRRLQALWGYGLVSCYGATAWHLTQEGYVLARALYAEGLV